ncbi:MAG: hypothetical protein FRX49_09174 [Trebouxia sp. A1-2]|nr:MAG: hypothetical protein FRX49_09174 [Trebouxia sp. A1-2]
MCRSTSARSSKPVFFFENDIDYCSSSSGGVRCQTVLKPAAGLNPRSPLVYTRSLSSRSFHFSQYNSGPPVRHVCQANDRTAAPVADQAPSPDGSAVLENSEQFQVHLKAAIMDPRVKEQNEVTPEVKTLVDELKSIAPKDRKKIKAEGTQVLISTEYENQYSVNIPFVIQDGPLAGVKGVQTTIGEYTIDDSEPVRQKIGFTALSLGPNTSDSSAKQKWMEVMKKENDKMDEEGKILLKFPEPMKGFRDFLYFDEQLQMSIGNRGSLTIIQQQA